MMQLNTVVLPAPFGPITLWMAPSATERSRRSTATRPPNRLVSRSQTRTGSPVTAGAATAVAASVIGPRLRREAPPRWRPGLSSSSILSRRLAADGHRPSAFRRIITTITSP